MFVNISKIASELNIDTADVKIGFTCSTFDLLHAGHIVMLQEAKSMCDYLICGLLTDPTLERKTNQFKPLSKDTFSLQVASTLTKLFLFLLNKKSLI